MCFISFSRKVVGRLKHELPDHRCYWIVEVKQNKRTGNWSPSPERLIRQAQDAGLDGLDLGDAPLIDQEFVDEIKRAGLGLYIWTVDSIETANHLKNAGVDGIATNRPALMRKHFAGGAGRRVPASSGDKSLRRTQSVSRLCR